MSTLTLILRDAWAAGLAMLPIGVVPAVTTFAAALAVSQLSASIKAIPLRAP